MPEYVIKSNKLIITGARREWNDFEYEIIIIIIVRRNNVRGRKKTSKDVLTSITDNTTSTKITQTRFITTGRRSNAVSCRETNTKRIVRSPCKCLMGARVRNDITQNWNNDHYDIGLVVKCIIWFSFLIDRAISFENGAPIRVYLFTRT